MGTKIVLVLIAVLPMIMLTGCSEGGSGGPPPSRTINSSSLTTTISDPATCGLPGGPYLHIYITIAGVKMHQNASAPPIDSGWVDLTPGLPPTQVDLLGSPDNSCILATLGSGTSVAAGDYQQIRLFLLDNKQASQVKNNACGSSANCVVLTTNQNPQPISVDQEVTSGIKIPSLQIAGGKVTVATAESHTLNVDFNCCSSIVVASDGHYRLVPMVHAGLPKANANSITGQLINSSLNAPISGGKTVVALEQLDGGGIYRVVMETVPDASGKFVFCPALPGIYYVVAVAVDGRGVAYRATITGGVQPGNSLGQIPLEPTTGINAAPATITGLLTTSTTSLAGTSADVSLSILQSITTDAGIAFVTIPQTLTSSATPTTTTASDASCPSGTRCAHYSLGAPAMTPIIGTFASSGTKYNTISGEVTYVVDALAFVPSSGALPNCSPSEQRSAPLAVTAGNTTNAPALTFTGCQ